jgi:polyhydroxyalkanoate synthesis regulator phasin
MSDTTHYGGGPINTGASNDDGSTADLAREQAAHVADTAANEGQHVVDVAKEEAAGVADEAKSQAKDLYRQAQTELKEQAAAQQDRVASGLQSISDELSQMADSSETHGVASELAKQVADRASGIASWIGQRDPGSLLGEIKAYARRNPGTFIAAAAVAGVVAGRLTRSLTSGAPESDNTSGTSAESDHPDAAATVPEQPVAPRAPMRAPTATIIPAETTDVGSDPQLGDRP